METELIAKNVHKIVFVKKEVSGIGRIGNSEVKVKLLFEGDKFIATSLQPMEKVGLFSSSGMKIAEHQADAEGTAQIMTSGLADGIYILRTINANITFIKK